MSDAMHPEAVIRAKRDGQELDAASLAAFVGDALTGAVTEGQMTAFLMAVWFRGMTSAETVALTRALLASGGRIDWRIDERPVVDKHSTGGVGDKVSLCLAPLVAACGARVPMVSGRGLGHTGGTLDKLACIPGFRSELELAEIRELVRARGLALAGQSDEMCPADRRLYVLRDVTATVDSIPLITASILSKKLAEGLDALVLDVKVGSGAFMKTLDAARALADALTSTGAGLGLRTTAFLTDMDQPLGRFVGNRVELLEALEVLEGRGPEDTWQLTRALGIRMLIDAEVAMDEDDAGHRLDDARSAGRGLEILEAVVAAQGGDLGPARQRASGLSRATARADRPGWVTRIDAEAVGRAAMNLGAGRARPQDSVDLEVGIELLLKRGDPVQSGEALATIEGRSPAAAEAAALAVQRALEIGEEAPAPVPLVLEVRP